MRIAHISHLCAALIVAATLDAQSPAPRLSGSIETGAAAVQQPLVRSGAAFYVAPSARLAARGFTIGGDAVFATGTPIWQSFLGNGIVQSPARRNVRLSSSAQLLKTSGLLPTLHGDVGVEWRNSAPMRATNARVKVGGLRYDGGTWRDLEIGGGLVRSHGAMLLAIDGSFIAARRPFALQQQLGVTVTQGAAFTAQALDLTPRMIWERGRLRADASVAVRAIERGLKGTRAGPQVSLTFATMRGVSLFLGGVQRLPDVRSGLPSGRTALLGLRVEASRVFSRAAAPVSGTPALLSISGKLVLDAGKASITRAEMRGDFTDWQARDCQPRGFRYFDCGALPPAGTYRVSVRVNNGEWQQPSNLAAAADDFGSVDGLLLTGGKP